MLDARANANASADARETLASDGRRTTTRVRNASSTVVVVDGASDAGMSEGKGRGKRTRARGMRREIFSSNSSGDNSAKGEARDAEMRRTSVGQRRERRGRHASGGRDVSLVARARDVASEATDVDEHALILSASVGARGRSKRARARAVVRNDDGGHVSEGARRATRRASAKRGKDSGESSQDDVSDDAVVRHWMTLDDACDGGAGWDEGHACDWEMKTAERARDGRSRDETLALADVVKGESHGNVPTFDEALFALHSLPSLPLDITAAFDAQECYDADETVPFISPEWIERPLVVASAGSDAEDDDKFDAFANTAPFLENDADWMPAPMSPVRFIREPEHIERQRRARELAWEAAEFAERERREATVKTALASPGMTNIFGTKMKEAAKSAYTNESAHDSFVTAADGRVFKIASALIDDDDDTFCGGNGAKASTVRLEDSAIASDAEESEGDHAAVQSMRKRKRIGTEKSSGRRPRKLSKSDKNDKENKENKIRATDIFISVNGKRQRRGCLHCGTIKTPQWRMGPEGKKTLCNACGVRHMKGILD